MVARPVLQQLWNPAFVLIADVQSMWGSVDLVKMQTTLAHGGSVDYGQQLEQMLCQKLHHRQCVHREKKRHTTHNIHTTAHHHHLVVVMEGRRRGGNKKQQSPPRFHSLRCAYPVEERLVLQLQV
eukprot:GHVS01012701.1.p2 GENE.GHVS01012701.1~~GHVS01012701.1.p2  ORF type:complete len:125 (-),score=26.01 GHVS01012701.1:90-464(-)